ncbi:cysteine hydrolase [Nocardia cyriacigeorgica]|uniref:cysteine hydrolase family protein n=1 Tax=Nocardia cyriacigeorgica TaxID=135487 RepID=UPI001893A468|nr:cysteine hydrolase family protein [Nocardia cyriacigeorgica]MBF6098506.1 cysteine hydrolase [Nocardia cyriacigeorgica]MBF6160664.1 cysteine hydrolase [Nocardia cyriacigeorgica]MBF6199569.1 cysteine hydrolase [Nocardia cyriacigeorgica]MBF6320132.1 cysteine hydrolase [Nocardia cyriacigeorgica]MBF6535468.1 cysteine hydrolase [Nocardia cyriacigeorgica]
MTITQASESLRSVVGLDDSAPRLRDCALIMIDYQNTYRTGVMALEDAEPALAAGARLLERARGAGIPVVHIINDGGEGTPYDIRAEVGAISAEVAPIDGEPVVVKQFPNAFHATELEQTLRDSGVEPGGDLVLAGFMTHMCVGHTAQGAFNLGYRPTVIAEASATRSLTGPDGTVVPAATLHTAALTTVTDLFGIVVPTVDALPD